MPYSVCTAESYSSFYLDWYDTSEWSYNVDGIDYGCSPKASIYKVLDIDLIIIIILIISICLITGLHSVITSQKNLKCLTEHYTCDIRAQHS